MTTNPSFIGNGCGGNTVTVKNTDSKIRMPSFWIAALKEHNASSGTWCVPKKGTDGYLAVKRIMDRMKRDATNQPKEQANMEMEDRDAPAPKPRRKLRTAAMVREQNAMAMEDRDAPEPPKKAKKEESAKKGTKPTRKCPICGKEFINLAEHITKSHMPKGISVYPTEQKVIVDGLVFAGTGGYQNGNEILEIVPGMGEAIYKKAGRNKKIMEVLWDEDTNRIELWRSTGRFDETGTNYIVENEYYNPKDVKILTDKEDIKRMKVLEDAQIEYNDQLTADEQDKAERREAESIAKQQAKDAEKRKKEEEEKRKNPKKAAEREKGKAKRIEKKQQLERFGQIRDAMNAAVRSDARLKQIEAEQAVLEKPREDLRQSRIAIYDNPFLSDAEKRRRAEDLNRQAEPLEREYRRLVEASAARRKEIVTAVEERYA